MSFAHLLGLALWVGTVGTEDYSRPDTRVAEAWAAGREAMQLGDLQQVQAGLDKIYQWQSDSGIRNLFTVSQSLLRAGLKAERERDQQRTQLYLDYAGKMSPQLLDVELVRATIHLRHQPFDVVTALLMVVKGLVQASNSATFVARWILYGVMLAATAIGLFILTVLTLLLRRPIQSVAHLIAQAVPVPLPAFPIRLLLWGGFLFLVQWGPGFAVLAALLLVGILGQRRERYAAGALAVLLAAVPWAGERAAVLCAGLGSPRFVEMSSWRDTTGSHAFVRGVEERWTSKSGNLSPTEALLLGAEFKRRGDFKAAADVLKPHRADPELKAVVLNNLAGARVALSDFKAAVTDYRAAIGESPAAALYHYNLSQVLVRKLLLPAEGEQEIATAGGLDREFVQGLIAKSSDNPNRFVVDEPIPLRTILRVGWEEGSQQGVAGFQTLWESFAPRLAPIQGMIAFAGAAAISLLAAVFLGGWSLSFSCKRCGCEACRWCKESQEGAALCPECHLLYGKRVEVEGRSREEKDAEIRRYGARTARVRLAASVLLLGGGQFLNGKWVKGLIGLFMWSLILGAWLAPNRLFAPILQAWVWDGVWGFTGIGFILWVFYLAGTIRTGRTALG
ncbi:MAG: hypothetical protein HYT87_04255 [Nitrospirae bacterium]|nr:hypothetical protein [Nitrospirota bacterium]